MSAAGGSVLAEINNMFSKITGASLAITSWDFFVWIFFALVAFFYALLFVSRGKLIAIFVSTFVSFVLVQLAPFLDLALGSRLGLTEIYQVKLAAFGMVFIVMLWVLSRVVFQSPVGAETFGMIGAFLMGISQVGFLTAVLLSFLPASITRSFSEWTAKIFLGADVFFYWALASVVLLLVFARKANKEVG
ncbi:MAG: hypothetical protein Q8R08_02570 [bacterium]|nr:hypothetical protein [bacterium]